MKQAGCNMTNAESYIRASIALFIALVALTYEWWSLLIVSAVLFYTAYKKFCLMYSLLGINKKYSIENYYYALLPQYSPYASCIFNEEGEIVYINDAAKQAFGQISNASDFGIMDSKECIHSDKVFDILYESTGNTYQLHIHGVAKEKVMLMYINNITKVLDLEYINSNLESKVQKALHENELKNHLLAQQSKFVTTGELMENIGHQWKQPLGALSALLANIQIRNSIIPLSMDEMDAEMNNASRLIRIMSTTVDDFRDFFKADKRKADFSIDACMNDVMLILGSSLKKESITVVNTIDPAIQIRGFKNEFTQVVLNIINNAKEALVEMDSPIREINVSTQIEGENVLLRISDTAGGISEEHLSKIFDSHFTTKAHKEGTGIGLHLSKIIIEHDMNGTIRAENRDKGMQFVVTLPVQEAAF